METKNENLKLYVAWIHQNDWITVLDKFKAPEGYTVEQFVDDNKNFLSKVSKTVDSDYTICITCVDDGYIMRPAED